MSIDDSADNVAIEPSQRACFFLVVALAENFARDGFRRLPKFMPPTERLVCCECSLNLSIGKHYEHCLLRVGASEDDLSA